MTGKNPKLDSLFRKSKTWRDEKQALRGILLEFPLAEVLRWRQPCYQFEDGNVVLISGFKDYVCLAFPKGALLKDTKKLLKAPGEHSQAMRQLRFTSVEEIEKNKALVKRYVKNAIDVQKKGLKVDFAAKKEMARPEELEAVFAKNKKFAKAFEALTPGRQRSWILHYTGAKQSKTRTSRVEKSMERVFEGKGLNER